MLKQIRSEFQKIYTTRTWLGIIFASLVFSAMTVFAYAQIAGSMGMPNLNTSEMMTLLYGGAATGVALALILGVIGATSEYRYGTIDHTYLVQPKRYIVLYAKLLIHGIIGAILGLVAFALAYLATTVAVSGKDHAEISTGELFTIAMATIAAYAIYTMLGVAFGSLVRNQLVGVAATFVWIFIFERLLVVFTPDIGKWLPGGAVNGLFGVTAILNGGKYFDRSTSGALLIAYAIVLIGLSLFFTPRRDVS